MWSKDLTAMWSIYREFHILKFKDLIYLQNCIFMLQIEQNKQLAAPFPGLKYCGESLNNMTRSAAKKITSFFN